MINYLNRNLNLRICLRLGFLILLLGCVKSFNLQAQGTKISGSVTDIKTGETLPGVNIVVQGTTTGTTTDAGGKFKITVPAPNSVLIFSYVGYITEQVSVEGKNDINVSLAPDITSLDDVVVIGYGTAKKKDLTGPISSIKGEKLASVPVASVTEALTGKLAGVQITTTEGSPDAAVLIRVRGGGSITQDNSPLYIVDGFPVGNITDIPPTDIQSVDILKDASSTAIYGSRGANGVIIITTKTAKGGKFTVSYNGYYGVKNVEKKLKVLSPYEFANWQYELAVLENNVPKQYDAYFGSFDDMNLYKSMNGTDWQDVVFGNTGTTQNHSISITGGNETMNFNASYNRIDDQAIMLGSKYNRDNLNLKLNAKPLKWLMADFDVRYSDTKVYGGGANDVTGTEKSTSDSRLKNAVIYTPIPITNMAAAGDDAEALSSLYPPTTTIRDNDRFQRTKNFNINGDISANLTKNLVFRSEVGILYTTKVDDRFYGMTNYFVNGGDASIQKHPAAQLLTDVASSFRNANTLTYSFKHNSHNVTLLAGEETLNTKDNPLTSVIDGYPVFFDAQRSWSLATQGTTMSTNNYFTPDDKMLSFFGRLNYDFKGKYLLSATYRADGSSKFAPGNQWGYFPSIAVAWRISDEQAFAGASGWLSNLKLRGSYGTAGNNKIPPLSYMQVYSSNPTTYLPASLATSYWGAGQTMANQNLKWETTVTRNIGLDYGLFKGRINGSVEVYKNSTRDLLIAYPVAGTGYTTQTRNIGKTSNRGLEATLDATLIDKKNFKLDFNFNISVNRNKVEDLGGLTELSANSAWTSDAQASNDYKVYVGQPVGIMYGYKTDGMYSTSDFNWNGTAWVLNNANANTPDNSSIDGPSWGPGALKLKDLNGDGVIDGSDRTIIGYAMPKNTGGFGFTAAFKGFDLAANFNWVYGNNIYNANKIEFTTANKYNYRNMLDIMNSSERWTNIDPATGTRVTDPAQLDALNANAKLWSPALSRYVFHSWAVEDGSFLRLNNLTLGYTIPSKLTTKLYIKQLRFYVSAYNLHVWTKYSGYDPEVDARRATSLTPGVDYSAYPKSRAYNFGINLTF